MHRVRVRVTNLKLCALPKGVLRSPQAARSLGNGVTVSWDMVAGPTPMRNRIEVVFSFSNQSDVERREIVHDFLENTLDVGMRHRHGAGEDVRSYGLVTPLGI